MKIMHAYTLPLLLAAVLLPSLGNAQQVLTLNVTGTLIGGTCDVNALDANQTVTLDPISRFDLAAAPGQAYRAKPFSIRLEGCAPGLTRAKFTFNGMPDANDNRQWANTAVGPAANVALHLRRRDTDEIISPFSIDARLHTLSIDAASRTATFPASVAYWRKTTGAPGEGGVAGQTVFTVDYE